MINIKRFIIIIIFFLVFGITGCVKQDNKVKNDGFIDPVTKINDNGSVELDSILNPEIKIPEIIVEGNFPSGKEKMVQAWNWLYPYYYKYLGKPTNLEDKGIKIIYDEDMTYKEVKVDVQNNSIKTGVIGDDYTSEPYEDPNNPMYFHVMHEVAHIFFQYDDKMVNFDFGQWIWEGHALIAHVLTRSEIYNEHSEVEAYDLVSSIGWNGINGVKSDADKYDREVVDWSATQAIRILTEVMSYDSNYDYIKRVNEGIIRTVNESKDPIISVDEYKEIINKAANNRLIDGKQPGDWLFSQPVSNIRGDAGRYLIVRPIRAAYYPNDFPEFEVALFERYIDENGDVKEKGISNHEVLIKIFDSDNVKISQVETKTHGNGITLFNGRLNYRFIPGAYRIEVEATLEDEIASGQNYFIIIPFESQQFSLEDNRIVIIPFGSKSNKFKPDVIEDIVINGADTRETISNMIILTAEPGSDIEIEFE